MLTFITNKPKSIYATLKQIIPPHRMILTRSNISIISQNIDTLCRKTALSQGGKRYIVAKTDTILHCSFSLPHVPASMFMLGNKDTVVADKIQGDSPSSPRIKKVKV